jgi:chlorite dismutase
METPFIPIEPIAKPCHSYVFFDTDPSIRSVQNKRLDRARASLRNFIETQAAKRDISFHSYATLGMKPGHRFMLHLNAATPDTIQLFIRDLLHTPLGGYLRVAYTLFGMTRTSPYKPKPAAAVEVMDGTPTFNVQKDTEPAPPEPAAADQPHRYLIVYPFTKTINWHLLPFEDRRGVMKAHVEVGRKWSGAVSQLLLYSYGVDDHEFVVSYYTDKLDDFQSLVMDMRATESRRHTQNDLPIFTCIHMPLDGALSMI